MVVWRCAGGVSGGSSGYWLVMGGPGHGLTRRGSGSSRRRHCFCGGARRSWCLQGCRSWSVLEGVPVGWPARRASRWPVAVNPGECPSGQAASGPPQQPGKARGEGGGRPESLHLGASPLAAPAAHDGSCPSSTFAFLPRPCRLGFGSCVTKLAGQVLVGGG
jgi:hypothetical protein